MINYIQPGETETFTAPAAVASGGGVLVGAVFGVATNAAAAGAPVEIKRRGIFSMPALSTDTITAGAKLYWDNANARLTTTASGNTLVGAAVAAKASGVATVSALLDGTIR